MTPSRRLVALSLAVACGMLWGCTRPAPPPAPISAVPQADGSQQVRVVVKDARYTPSTIHAQAGKPLRMEFFRDEPEQGHSCGEYLTIPDLGIRERLPAGEEITVTVPPQPPGVLGFECGMRMMKGKIVFNPA